MLMNSFQFVIIYDDLAMNSVLETKSQVMHFPPNDSLKKSLDNFLGLGSETKVGKSHAIMYLFGRGPIFFGQVSHGISNSDRQKTQ